MELATIVLIVAVVLIYIGAFAAGENPLEFLVGIIVGLLAIYVILSFAWDSIRSLFGA